MFSKSPKNGNVLSEIVGLGHEAGVLPSCLPQAARLEAD
jgi:hypothetical protein